MLGDNLSYRLLEYPQKVIDQLFFAENVSATPAIFIESLGKDRFNVPVLLGALSHHVVFSLP